MLTGLNIKACPLDQDKWIFISQVEEKFTCPTGQVNYKKYKKSHEQTKNKKYCASSHYVPLITKLAK